MTAHLGSCIERAAAALLCSAVCGQCLAATPSPVREIIGDWKITRRLDLIDVTSRNEEQARQLIGHVLTITPNAAQLDDYRCAPADFKTKQVETKLYIREYAGISAERLGLPDPVTVVDVSCTQVFIKAKDRIVLFWDGWFFEATRKTR